MKEGQVLGKIQRELVEKMEELTLYILQLSKENQALRQRLADLESRE